jgi:hypothetical protein
VIILIVGADRLGNIPVKLYEEGAKEIIHWSGRNKSLLTKEIPRKVDKIIIFCDFLNHRLMQHVRQQAKIVNIPIVYKKRSITHKAVS